jgi:hypothetical protein
MVKFRRYYLLNEDNVKMCGSITAAIAPLRGESDGQRSYAVGLSYCSPKEVQYSKKQGQSIAYYRLISDDPIRGRRQVTCNKGGLTSAIRGVIIEESRRKNITWITDLGQGMQIV